MLQNVFIAYNIIRCTKLSDVQKLLHDQKTKTEMRGVKLLHTNAHVYTAKYTHDNVLELEYN